MDGDRLQQIYDDAGRPGAQAFRFAVRRALPGIQISETEAKAFVASQSQGQIFRGRIPSDGKVPGGGREDTVSGAVGLSFFNFISDLISSTNSYGFCIILN